MWKHVCLIVVSLLLDSWKLEEREMTDLHTKNSEFPAAVAPAKKNIARFSCLLAFVLLACVALLFNFDGVASLLPHWSTIYFTSTSLA